jgi:hypothetical protein
LFVPDAGSHPIDTHNSVYGRDIDFNHVYTHGRI